MLTASSSVSNHSHGNAGLEHEGEEKFVQGRAFISDLLSASISSTNWQKIAIISLFASYVLFQQARLSHYGRGKSSLTGVETLLVPPFFLGSELGMNSPPQSQTTILFLSLLFRQHLVYYTFLFYFTFFSAWFIAWMDVFCAPRWKCIVHGGK